MRTSSHHRALATVIRGLAAEKNPGCLLDPCGTFLFVNEAWDRHGAATGNGAAGSTAIGTSWLDHVQGDEVRRIHAALLERVQRVPHPRALVQVAEANTSTRAALLATRFEPVLQQGDLLGVRVELTVVRERPIEELYEVVHRAPDACRQPDGAVVLCACCRRVRDPADAARWDLVPELMELPITVRHELCELCAELHYRAP